jgi:hypothetical protein
MPCRADHGPRATASTIAGIIAAGDDVVFRLEAGAIPV